jgi:ACS family D-galactonate transporter-like MFS transporter
MSNLGEPRRSQEANASNFTRWIILVLLAIGAVIAFASRTNLSEALVVPTFIDQFHLSDVDRGTLNSAFFWTYAALQIPMGWIVDRYGVKIPYAVSFLIWCLASAATGMISTFSALLLMRMLTGAGEAIVTPASYRWMRTNFSESESGFAVGIYMLGTKFGPAIGYPLAAWLIAAYDWRWMFLIIGVAGLLWLPAWMFLVEGDGPKTLATAKRKASAVPFSAIMSSPLVWGTIIINFCYNYFVFYCMTWMPAYLVEQRHLSLTKESLYTTFSFIGIAIVALAAGWIADLLIKRGFDAVFVRKAFVVGGFALASTEILGVQAATVQEALFWSVASLSGLGLATANHLALCRLTLIPAPAVGLVTGVQMVATSFAGIVAPILSGWLKQTSGGYTAPMQVIFFFLVLGALTCIVLLRAEWAPKVSEAPAPAAA